MVIIDESLTPIWARIIDQTENFVFIRLDRGWLEIEQVEELLAAGFQLCGVSSSDLETMTICCKKV